MIIVFFGNTKYSLIGAKIIHEQLGLSCIVTIADRPDKKGTPQPSPLKTFALEKHIPVLTVNKLDKNSTQELANLHPDFFVVEDYGLILPKTLLSIPQYASLNIHHSLLPKYRGTSPAPTAILQGDSTSGVTVIHMAEKIDAGDMLAQEKYHMTPDETTDSLLTILNSIGAKLLIETIKNFTTTEAKPQDEKKATFTKMMTKQDGFIDSNNPPEKTKLDRMIRAYYPWPTVWTRLMINGTEKIVKFLPTSSSLRGSSFAGDEAISSKFLMQVEGKNPMRVKDFINGYPQLKEIIKKLLPASSSL